MVIPSGSHKFIFGNDYHSTGKMMINERRKVINLFLPSNIEKIKKKSRYSQI
jgi:hypothetical protein